MCASKMFKKHLWKSDILSKNANHRPTSLLKTSLFHRCFQTFCIKNQLLGFCINGTLVKSGLIWFIIEAFVGEIGIFLTVFLVKLLLISLSKIIECTAAVKIFRVYKSIWSPRLNVTLTYHHEKGNSFEAFVIKACCPIFR